MQSQGGASCLKHFADKNQERQRGSVDFEMGDRTMREIYLPALKAAVQEGGAMAVMTAYNKFRGQYCSQNDLLLKTILKGEWGFSWRSCRWLRHRHHIPCARDTVASAEWLKNTRPFPERKSDS